MGAPVARVVHHPSGCSVETYTIDSTELGTKEAIIIQVVLSGKDKDACAPARELAKGGLAEAAEVIAPNPSGHGAVVL